MCLGLSGKIGNFRLVASNFNFQFSSSAATLSEMSTQRTPHTGPYLRNHRVNTNNGLRIGS